jgi:hydrogenase small subunit
MNSELKKTLLPDAIKEVHAFWLAGGSCDGCSIATVGASSPSAESLMMGTIPGIPKIVLHHPVLSVEAGKSFMHPYHMAAEGKLNAPYVTIFEGSLPDENYAKQSGGYWSGMGVEDDEDGNPQPVSTAEWLRRLAKGAAAVIAVGTCATWGGIPAAAGNPTRATGVMDFLGADYRSSLGLPVINIPGCAPQGDNITETIAAVLLYLHGIGPLPDFDELGRPAWLFDETVHRGCTRAGFYEEGIFAENYGGHECLVELGCWGPVVQCNINKRGAQNHLGGCMNVGAPCIGCTMPGFPDAFAPFYKAAPGTAVSSNMSRTTGLLIRNLRGITQSFHNKSARWKNGNVPSGWAHVEKPGLAARVTHYFYEKLQFSNTPKPGSKLKQSEPNK